MVNSVAELKGSLNELRLLPEFVQSIDSLTMKTDQKTQEAFLALAAKYPSAFGNPKEPISFDEGVRRFVLVAKDFQTEGWNKMVSLKSTIKEIDSLAARMSFWMLMAVTHKDPGNLLAFTKVDGMGFSEGYPAFLSHLEKNNGLGGKSVLQFDDMMKIRLVNKGTYAFPAGLERFSPDLRTIELPQLWIRVLTAAIGQFAQLRHLNLSNNSINNVPREIGNLSELRTLDLSGNRIEEMPDSISGCTALEKLNLSKNPLKALPAALTALAHLQKVDIRSTECDLSECQTYLALDDRGVVVKLGQLESSQSDGPSLSPAFLSSLGGGLPNPFAGSGLQGAMLEALLKSVGETKPG